MVRKSLNFLFLIIFLSTSLNCATGRRGSPYSSAPKGTRLMWPVSKRGISQYYRGPANNDPHDGIDIPAPKGTRIFSSEAGTVVYAGEKFHGYGRMIIVEHKTGLSTLYAHCQKLLVKSGDNVRKGSLIGTVGNTGRATAPHLHFEVRHDLLPINPLEVLR